METPAMLTMQPPKPTEAELMILQALWRLGPSTVRTVTEDLARFRRTGYTTVLKLLQIMTEKGLVERDTAQRAHVYRSKYPQEDTQRQLLDDLLRRAFGGATSRLMHQALSGAELSPEEVTEIRSLIDRYAPQA